MASLRLAKSVLDRELAMLRWVLLCGAALVVAGCEARAQAASPSASAGIPEIITRCIDGQDVEGPIAACTRAIEAKAASPELQALAYHTRALAHCVNNDPRASIADEDKAIALVPNFPQAYAHRANCKMSLGDPEGAQTDYAMVLKLAPDVPGYYEEAALVDNWAGDHDQALRRLDQLMRLKPDYTTTVDLRAKTLFNLGRYDEAARDFAQAVKMFPRDARPVLWLHLARVRAGQPDAAEFAANKARLGLSDWPRPVFDLLEGRASVAAVRQAAQGAAEEEEGECEAVVFGGEHLLTKGDRDGARKLFIEAVNLCSPGSSPQRYLTAWAELKRIDPMLKDQGPW